jgi:hypothetical protein
MRFQAPTSRLLRAAAAAALLLALSFTALPRPARADALPQLRQGKWHFLRTVNGRKIEITRCTSPTDDMRRQSAMLEKAGVKVGAVKKSGSKYDFSAEGSVRGIRTRTHSVLTVEGPDAYRLEVDGVTDGRPTRETLVARRVGDCAK